MSKLQYFLKLTTAEKIEVSEKEYFSWNTYPRSDFVKVVFRSGIIADIPRESIVFGYTVLENKGDK